MRIPPIEFIIFGLVILGIALFHRHSLKIAACGLVTTLIYSVTYNHLDIFIHLKHELRSSLNLLGLILGFSILAKYFEDTQIPEVLPRFLPDDWKGGFVLLLSIAFISGFLDNIAAALIGATIANHVYRKKIHLSYLIAIIAASNAGGAWSPVGDTTTTMMWIEGVQPKHLAPAAIGSLVATLFFAIISSRIQQNYQPITKDEIGHHKIDMIRVIIVGMILIGAIITNISLDFPALGVWITIFLGMFLRKPAWQEIPSAFKSSVFLITLVLTASLMPVKELPEASWPTALVLGFISSVFDNIPLTKLALVQGGYDWGILAYAVGFGGSMMWFGSSAGVTVTERFEHTHQLTDGRTISARSVKNWLLVGMHVVVAYIIGFFAMLIIHGWNPTPLAH